MLQPGTVLEGNIEILNEIGRGGMSIVYLAINKRANKTWAVKIIRKDGGNDDELVKENLIAEIETLKSIKHPKIPEISQILDRDDSYIIIMDYVEGKSLEDIRTLLDENGNPITEKGQDNKDYLVFLPQSEDDVTNWAMQLCEIFEYLHDDKLHKGGKIIYRDTKPSNIMLKPDGDVVIVDFGTAKTYEIDNKGSTTGLGTPGYAAPEQYGGQGRTDERTDIYALGVTMYSLLTGINPQKNHIENFSVRAVDKSISQGLDRIILKCTQYNREDRYQSCAELLYDLQHKDDPTTKAILKLTSFLLVFIVSCLMFVAGFVMQTRAQNIANDNYDKILKDAAQVRDYSKKIELYKQAIEIPNQAGNKEAYLDMIAEYKVDDGKFTDDESEMIENLVIKNRKELTKPENLEGYIDICYEIGKMYWFHYQDENRVTRAKYASDWFRIVTERSDKNNKYYNLAKVYGDIGLFYRDISTMVSEAGDNGMYRNLFNNTMEALNMVSGDEKETEIVKLELLEMSRSILQQYATRLKRDGVTYDEIMTMLEIIKTNTEKVNVLADDISDITQDEMDEASKLKYYIKNNYNDTKNAVDTAYKTNKQKDGDQ